MCVSDAIDTFDALMRKNVYGFRKRILNINNDMIKCMYNCTAIVNGPMWASWAESLYIVRLLLYILFIYLFNYFLYFV